MPKMLPPLAHTGEDVLRTQEGVAPSTLRANGGTLNKRFGRKTGRVVRGNVVSTRERRCPPPVILLEALEACSRDKERIRSRLPSSREIMQVSSGRKTAPEACWRLRLNYGHDHATRATRCMYVQV